MRTLGKIWNQRSLPECVRFWGHRYKACCFFNRDPRYLACDEELAAGFCMPDWYKLVDICGRRNTFGFNCAVNRGLPGIKSSNGKPGEEFENGVIFFSYKTGRIRCTKKRTMLIECWKSRKGMIFIVLAIVSMQCNHPTIQKHNKKAVLKYLSGLHGINSGGVISGQFESWGSEVRPLNDTENFLNIIHQKTGKWVGLVGAEYHMGQEVYYEKPNQLFEQYWNQGGFCQLYLIMTNPAQPASNNGGGKCDIKSILNPGHSYNTYFYNELDKVATGLQELQKKGVIVFLNPFAGATANWFWWGGTNPTDFIALYRNTYNYLVTEKGLDNLIFIYEPSCFNNTALQYYPGDKYVDIIGFSLFVDYDKEIDSSIIQNYQQMKQLGKPLAISQWGPRRGQDQTNSADQPPADNLKLVRAIQKYFPEIVWWMNWNYAYSICTGSNSNYHASELLNHPGVINRDEIKLH
jgi:mannan endo-1,4-beta-mannosidase